MSICCLPGFSIRLSLAVALVDMTDVNSTTTNVSNVKANYNDILSILISQLVFIITKLNENI